MRNVILDSLLTDDFRARLCFIATPTALRRLLQRSPKVESIRQGLQIGTLDEGDIGSFVKSLMNDLRPGSPFRHDLAISAIAVALERRGTRFAERFLTDLATLQAAEMNMSIRVSRECLGSRSLISGNESAVLHCAYQPGAGAEVVRFQFGQGCSSFIAPDVHNQLYATFQQPLSIGGSLHGHASPSLAELRIGGR